MCGRIFAIVFIVIALLLAIFASILPQEKLATIIYISRFFDIMLPVLAVGALVKYLCSHKWKSCVRCESKPDTVVTKLP
jgi:peptidoglycan/LPS O-acetylase OafA/YrhL